MEQEVLTLVQTVDQVNHHLRDLSGDFMKSTSFSSMGVEMQHAQKQVKDLQAKLIEAKKALADEKSRREAAEEVKTEITELKKMLKKKRKRRRSYSRSRSRSRSSSTSRSSRSYSRR